MSTISLMGAATPHRAANSSPCGVLSNAAQFRAARLARVSPMSLYGTPAVAHIVLSTPVKSTGCRTPARKVGWHKWVHQTCCVHDAADLVQQGDHAQRERSVGRAGTVHRCISAVRGPLGQPGSAACCRTAVQGCAVQQDIQRAQDGVERAQQRKHPGGGVQRAQLQGGAVVLQLRSRGEA